MYCTLYMTQAYLRTIVKTCMLIPHKRRDYVQTVNYVTSTINQQMHLYNFHLKHFKTFKTTPT